MFRLIFIHELTQELYNYKFILLLVLAIVLPVITTPLLIHDFQDRLQAYSLAVEKDARELRKIPAYSALQVAVHKRPSPLAIFSEGIENQTSRRVMISLKQLLTLDRQVGSGNPFLAIFPSFDLATVVLMLFSLFALVFSYNLVCGEKENGTLALVLSHGVTRGEFLLGKIAASLVVLLIPLAFFFAITIVIVEVMSPEAVKLSEWKYVLLIFLASMLHTVVFHLLGVLFSTVTHRSATSFLLSLSCWAVLVVVMPQVVFNLSHNRRMGYSDDGLRRDAAQSARISFEQIAKVLRENPPPRWEFRFPASFVIYDATPELVTNYSRQLGRIEEDLVDSISRMIELQYEYFQVLYAQHQTLALGQLASPAGAYYFLTTSLCGTGGSAYFNFLKSCFRYRGELLGYFRSRNLFASPTMFIAQSSLDLSGVPHFAEQEWRKEDHRQIVLGFAFLVLLAAITFAMAYVLFLKFDVR